MRRMNRRSFLGQAAATVGAAALSGSIISDAEAAKAPKSASDKVRLGKTTLKPSFLGVGTGTIGWNHESNQTRMGQEEFTRLIRHAYDQGITYYDCADMYGSHPYLKKALKGIPREKIMIQSKIISRDPVRAKADIDRFLTELGMDYIDSLLMHVVTEPTWPTDFEGVRDVLSEAKEKKKIRYHGCSCHGIEALRAASKTPWVEVDLARINHKGVKMDDKPETVVETLKGMKSQGKGLIGMKILGEGTITSDEDKDASLKFVLSSKTVDAIVIGFESPRQLDEMIQRINKTFKALQA